MAVWVVYILKLTQHTVVVAIYTCCPTVFSFLPFTQFSREILSFSFWCRTFCKLIAHVMTARYPSWQQADSVRAWKLRSVLLLLERQSCWWASCGDEHSIKLQWVTASRWQRRLQCSVWDDADNWQRCIWLREASASSSRSTAGL